MRAMNSLTPAKVAIKFERGNRPAQVRVAKFKVLRGTQGKVSYAR